MQRTHIYALNIVRILCSIGVVFSHSFSLLDLNNDWLYQHTQYDSFGTVCVAIFFSISGYLMHDSWKSAPRLDVFFFKRLLRILPGLYGVILAAVLLLPIIQGIDWNIFWNNEYSWKYFNNLLVFPTELFLPYVFDSNLIRVANGPIWSIPYEVTMYAIIALVYALTKTRWCGIIIGTLLVLFMSYHVWVYYFEGVDTRIIFINLALLTRYGVYFLMGSLLALYWHRISQKIFFAMLSVLCVIIALYNQSTYILLMPFALPFLVLYSAIELPISTLTSIRNFPDISYGIYLYAFPIQQIIISQHDRAIGPYRVFLYTMPIVILCALISTYLIEKPALKYKKYLIPMYYPININQKIR